MNTKTLFIPALLLLYLFTQCEKPQEASKNGKAEYEYMKLGSNQATGWLHHVLMTEVNGFSGHMDEYAPEVMRKPFINNDLPDIDYTLWWDGESTGNWIDGFIRLAFITRDTMMLRKAHTWVNQVMEAQATDEEPYIGVYPKTHPKGNRWTHPVGELWPQSRAYKAMLAYYDATGKEKVLESVKKAANLTIEHFHKYREDMDTAKQEKLLHGVIYPGLNNHALGIVEPMLKLYEITGEEKYLEFSEYIYDKLKFLVHYIVNGRRFIHGVHVGENMRIPAMLYEFNERKDLLNLSTKGIDLISEKYVNATGVMMSDEWVSLAKPNRASEYCTITEWILYTTELARITGNMRYADMAEKCFFNAAMGQRLPNGMGVQYFGYPNQLRVDYENEDQVTYGPNHYPMCCNPNATRVFPYFTQRMWMKTPGNGLAAVLYGPSEISFTPDNAENPVTIKEETRYPFSDEIRFHFSGANASSFPLTLKIPVWCNNPEIKINNQSINFTKNDNNAVTIERTWEDGDEIILYLPMKIQLDFNDYAEMVSVNRGPILYSLNIPSRMEKVHPVAPGYHYYNFFPDPEFDWNVALTFFEANPDTSFSYVESETPVDDDELWKKPAGKIHTEVQVIDHWCHTCSAKHIDQPPIPMTPIYRRWRDVSQNKNIELVPFGTTQLRISTFPYFVRVGWNY